MQYLSDVHEFHEKFDIEQPLTPRQLPPDLAKFRLEFLKEELDEYERSLHDGDIEGQLDALVDLVVVALGTALISGFDFDAAWRRVHEANMAKVRAKADGSDSKRGSGFDIVKPEGWTPPDHSDLVRPDHVRGAI